MSLSANRIHFAGTCAKVRNSGGVQRGQGDENELCRRRRDRWNDLLAGEVQSVDTFHRTRNSHDEAVMRASAGLLAAAS